MKSNKNCIKFPHLDLKTLQIKLFTDAGFNNLPNGGSQGGQIIFVTDGNSLCPLHWNSSKDSYQKTVTKQETNTAELENKVTEITSPQI